jgi:hypothetical protein
MNSDVAGRDPEIRFTGERNDRQILAGKGVSIS